jgi:hypothetical protein
VQDTNAVHAGCDFERFSSELGASKIERRHVRFKRVAVIPANVLDLTNSKEDRQRQRLVTDMPLLQGTQGSFVKRQSVIVVSLIVAHPRQVEENGSVDNLAFVAETEGIAEVIYAFVVLRAMLERSLGRIRWLDRRG